jgi:hypothetical protein
MMRWGCANPRRRKAEARAEASGKERTGGTRHGFALAEAIVTLTATTILGAAMLGLLATQTRLAATLAGRAEAADALLLSAGLLGRELRAAQTDHDIYGVSRDTLAHRAFRATALVCDTAGGASVARSRGIRLPDPGKDSVVILSSDGESAAALKSVADAQGPACDSLDGRLLSIRLDSAAAAPGDALLFFERGSYHLHDRALRWRAGAAGRQPLTAEVIRTAGSAFTRTPDGLHLLLTAPLDAPHPRLDLRIRSLQPPREP